MKDNYQLKKWKEVLILIKKGWENSILKKINYANVKFFLNNLKFAQDTNKLQIPIVVKNIWQSYINEIAIMIVNI